VDAAFRGHRGRAGFRDRADADPDAKPARGGRAAECAPAVKTAPQMALGYYLNGRSRSLVAPNNPQ
jgi:hypothetical protein